MVFTTLKENSMWSKLKLLPTTEVKLTPNISGEGKQNSLTSSFRLETVLYKKVSIDSHLLTLVRNVRLGEISNVCSVCVVNLDRRRLKPNSTNQ